MCPCHSFYHGDLVPLSQVTVSLYHRDRPVSKHVCNFKQTRALAREI
jgi:hypothetical protein